MRITGLLALGLSACLHFGPVLGVEDNTVLTGDCVPSACDAGSCGVFDDGCGTALDCGGCPEGETCGGGGIDRTCGAPQLTDLAVALANVPATVELGAPMTFAVIASNASAAAAVGASISVPLPAPFSSVTWTCTAMGDALCPAASGSGTIAAVARIGALSSLTFAVTATIAVDAAASPITTSASVNVTSSIDPVAANNVANLSLPVALPELSSLALTGAGTFATQVRVGVGNITLAVSGTKLRGVTGLTIIPVAGAALVVSSLNVTGAAALGAVVNVLHGAVVGSYAVRAINVAGASAPIALEVTAITAGGSGTDIGLDAVGTTLKPFRTLHHAISVAASGDRIALGTGDYSAEPWPVCASPPCGSTLANVPAGVTIEGVAGSASESATTVTHTVLDAGYTAASCSVAGSDNSAFVLDAGGSPITLKNLALRGFRNAVVVRGAASGPIPAGDVILDSVRIEGNCDTGVNINRGVRVRVRGPALGAPGSPPPTTIYGHQYGIIATGIVIDHPLGAPSTNVAELFFDGQVNVHDNGTGVVARKAVRVQVNGKAIFTLNGIGIEFQNEDNNAAPGYSLDVVADAGAFHEFRRHPGVPISTRARTRIRRTHFSNAASSGTPPPMFIMQQSGPCFALQLGDGAERGDNDFALSQLPVNSADSVGIQAASPPCPVEMSANTWSSYLGALGAPAPGNYPGTLSPYWTNGPVDVLPDPP
ncbi:MAG: hypothetical protein IT381_10205 [Deltaproteobacteria bacterium]|nr:hypothetical protein [Deltaproteobacteria bacterium]